MVKGEFMYAPKEFVEELNMIGKDFDIKRKSDRLRLLAKSSRIGRELNLLLRNR